MTSLDLVMDVQLEEVDKTLELICRRVKTGTFVAVWRNERGGLDTAIETTAVRAGGSIPDEPYERGEWAVYLRSDNEWSLEDVGGACDGQSLLGELRSRAHHPAFARR